MPAVSNFAAALELLAVVVMAAAFIAGIISTVRFELRMRRANRILRACRASAEYQAACDAAAIAWATVRLQRNAADVARAHTVYKRAAQLPHTLERRALSAAGLSSL